jgi:hypothetical protein
MTVSGSGLAKIGVEENPISDAKSRVEVVGTRASARRPIR